MITIAELIEKLEQLPSHWEIYATKSGGSLETRDPDGVEYAYVFTDPRDTKRLVDRRRLARKRAEFRAGSGPKPPQMQAIESEHPIKEGVR